MNDKVWLVTGASKGLGLAVVKAALQHGHRVAATTRDVEKLTAEVNAPADRFLAINVVLTDEASICQGVQTVVERFGQIDVLVNNAGYALLGALEELSDAEVRANFDINVFGVLNMLRGVLPVMRSQRRGHVINIASISGSVGGASTSVYSASKAAVILLSESLAGEVEDLGIRVTAICPGGFRTDFLDKSSSRQAAQPIPDYRMVHQVVAQYGQLNKNQGGDPSKAAEVMIQLAAMDAPPARLYLGSDALRGIQYKLQDVAKVVAQYQSLSQSTHFAR